MGMTEFDILIAAHEANDNLGLGLTPTQIVRVIERHEGRRRPRPAKTHYADPVAEEVIRRNP